MSVTVFVVGMQGGLTMITTKSVDSSRGCLESSLYDEESRQANKSPDGE